MTSSSSLYGSTPQSGNVSSSNFTTLYSGGNAPAPSGNLVIPGTLTVNGCAILTNCSAFSLLPTTAESIFFGGAATAMSIGSGSGVTTINNQLATANYTFPVADGVSGQVLVTDGSGTLSFAPASTVGKTYSIDASATTGGANFNLVSSDPSTDTIKFANGSGISIVRTDASTITITNTDPGSTGVTSITGTANQINVSSPTGAVTLSTPQDIATTSTPTFAGVNAGNVTVGVTTDNTITTTTGDLVLDASSNQVSATSNFYVEADTTLNNGTVKTNSGTVTLFNTTATSAAVLGAATSISMGAFSGTTTINNSLDAGAGTLFVDKTTTRVGINNPTPLYELHIDRGADGFTQFGMTTAERTALWTMNDGDDLLSLNYGSGNRLQFDPTNQWFVNGYTGFNTSTPAYTVDVNGTGNFQGVITGGLKINGSSSGYSNFIAPTTGSNLNYTLPGSAGAANTVLTNDGSGVLSWALPGGGGSTFGNITIAVATDNTISTTTGDLVLASATNLLDASTLGATFEYVSVDNQANLDSNTLTTTSTSTVTLMPTTRNAMTGLINIIQGSNVHCLNFTVLRVDATTALLTTFAEMYNNISLGNFTADVSSGSLRLRVTPTSATSTVFSVVRTSLT